MAGGNIFTGSGGYFLVSLGGPHSTHTVSDLMEFTVQGGREADKKRVNKEQMCLHIMHIIPAPIYVPPVNPGTSDTNLALCNRVKI